MKNEKQIFKSVLVFILIVCSSCEKDDLNYSENQNDLKFKLENFTTNSTFNNPILPGGPDPWIIQKEGIYYYTYTQGSKLVILETKNPSDLASSVRHEVWTPPTGTMYSKNLWAPELHYINDKWYFYFAADDGQNANHRMYVLENSSTSPTEGTWVFKGQVTDETNEWAIDGTIFTHQNQLYTVWSGGNAGAAPQKLYIAKMSNPWTISSEKKIISEPEYSWEMNGAAINEGPQILLNPEGQIYLIYSGSGYWVNGYCLGQLHLEKNSDPMVKENWIKKPEPVFSMKASSNAYGPGHNGFFKSPDGTEDWIIYHARLGADGGSRDPRIQRFNWNSDGSPNFGEPVSTDTELKKPSGEPIRMVYLKDYWSIAGFSSEEVNNSRLAYRLIDNNYNSYWITRYSTNPTNYPDHWITIDMGVKNKVDGFVIAQKEGDRKVKEFKIEISDDNEKWKSLGLFKLNDFNLLEQYLDLPSTINCRYFKLIPTSGFDSKLQPGLSEIGAYLNI